MFAVSPKSNTYGRKSKNFSNYPRIMPPVKAANFSTPPKLANIGLYPQSAFVTTKNSQSSVTSVVTKENSRKSSPLDKLSTTPSFIEFFMSLLSYLTKEFNQISSSVYEFDSPAVLSKRKESVDFEAVLLRHKLNFYEMYKCYVLFNPVIPRSRFSTSFSSPLTPPTLRSLNFLASTPVLRLTASPQTEAEYIKSLQDTPQPRKRFKKLTGYITSWIGSNVSNVSGSSKGLGEVLHDRIKIIDTTADKWLTAVKTKVKETGIKIALVGKGAKSSVLMSQDSHGKENLKVNGKTTLAAGEDRRAASKRLAELAALNVYTAKKAEYLDKTPEDFETICKGLMLTISSPDKQYAGHLAAALKEYHFNVNDVTQVAVVTPNKFMSPVRSWNSVTPFSLGNWRDLKTFSFPHSSPLLVRNLFPSPVVAAHS